MTKETYAPYLSWKTINEGNKQQDKELQLMLKSLNGLISVVVKGGKKKDKK